MNDGSYGSQKKLLLTAIILITGIICYNEAYSNYHKLAYIIDINNFLFTDNTIVIIVKFVIGYSLLMLYGIAHIALAVIFSRRF